MDNRRGMLISIGVFVLVTGLLAIFGAIIFNHPVFGVGAAAYATVGMFEIVTGILLPPKGKQTCLNCGQTAYA